MSIFVRHAVFTTFHKPGKAGLAIGGDILLQPSEDLISGFKSLKVAVSEIPMTYPYPRVGETRGNGLHAVGLITATIANIDRTAHAFM